MCDEWGHHGSSAEPSGVNKRCRKSERKYADSTKPVYNDLPVLQKINQVFMMHLAVFKQIFNYAEITIVGCILRHTLDEVFRNIHTIVRITNESIRTMSPNSQLIVL